MPLHNHLIVNGYTNTPPTDEDAVIQWMRELVEEIDMKIIQGPYASYVSKEGNRGITCIVMIETSHIALHVWDEPEPAHIQFDLYTCSVLPVIGVLKNLNEKLGVFEAEHMLLERSKGINTIHLKNYP